MKKYIPYFASAIGLAIALPASAADEKRASQEQKKELRVIVGADHDGARPMFRTRTGEKEVVTFLGVNTSPISATLTVQLGLPDGSGLVISSIEADTPAASALKEHDILLKLDDQILVDSHQLQVLIRGHKEGDEVTLTYVR